MTDPDDSDRFHYEIQSELEMQEEQEDFEYSDWLSEREKSNRDYQMEHDK